MQQLAIKIFWGMMGKLLTEAFASKIAVHMLRGLADSIKNKLMHDLVDSVADALEVK